MVLSSVLCGILSGLVKVSRIVRVSVLMSSVVSNFVVVCVIYLVMVKCFEI